MSHVKAIKLKNGELMACITDTDVSMATARNSAVLSVRNPVVFNSFKFMDNDGELVETISMQPLLPMCESDIVEVNSDHIFAISEMRPLAAQRYQEFLEHISEVREAEDLHDAMEDKTEAKVEEDFSLLESIPGDKILH